MFIESRTISAFKISHKSTGTEGWLAQILIQIGISNWNINRGIIICTSEFKIVITRLIAILKIASITDIIIRDRGLIYRFIIISIINEILRRLSSSFEIIKIIGSRREIKIS